MATRPACTDNIRDRRIDDLKRDERNPGDDIARISPWEIVEVSGSREPVKKITFLYSGQLCLSWQIAE